MEIWDKEYVYLQRSVQQRSLCYKYLEFNSSTLIPPPEKIKNKIKIIQKKLELDDICLLRPDTKV